MDSRLRGNDELLQLGLSKCHSGKAPIVDAWFIIVSVPAACKAPVFSNRMLATKRDLNRCFKAPFNDEQG
ncbi:MAG: hypothetical protein ACI8O8_002315 [Oleiphilaceae bacterium]|jgi:hypothetical protein